MMRCVLLTTGFWVISGILLLRVVGYVDDRVRERLNKEKR